MKEATGLVYKVFLAAVLCWLIFWLTGCGFFAQPGETSAEGHRRHVRNVRINNQEMMKDVDAFFLADKPSKASSSRVPPEIP